MSQHNSRESDILAFHAQNPLPETFRYDSGLGDHVVLDSHDPFVFLTRLNYIRESPTLKSIMWAAYRFHEAPISPAHPEILRDKDPIGPDDLNVLDGHERDVLQKYISYITTFDDIAPPMSEQPSIASNGAEARVEPTPEELDAIVATISQAVKRGQTTINGRTLEEYALDQSGHFPDDYRQVLLQYITIVCAAQLPHSSSQY